ncbi:dodecin domain-containing protein [Oceanihabitans sp. IOP_32]|uniref:dodecin family protein n=1 Tax=Oceanihabitans sp. IOP_32 TaxID=2529032 RepID=UPI0012934131|nr:dodecin family protein [Oceanihabitans sp. IOP_32]QFZ55331.1 dodecin domain-containing protein [Oceanihabitans sp. IOP_32]
MSVLKVIEVLGNSPVSFDDAVKNVVKEASKTVKNIKSVYVKDMQAKVEDNKVTQFRVTTKVCFLIED